MLTNQLAVAAAVHHRSHIFVNFENLILFRLLMVVAAVLVSVVAVERWVLAVVMVVVLVVVGWTL